MEPTPQGQELSGQVLFYKQPEPLSLEAHSKLGIKRIERPFDFLRASNLIPVTVSEFGMASGSYPIIFIGEQKTPLIVMGIRQDQNLFVTENGQLEEDAYMPAFVQRYPFVFASDDSRTNFRLCVDRGARMVSDQPDVPFFEGDKASNFTEQALKFCEDFERQARSTEEFVKILQSHDLFEQKTVSITPRDQNGNEGAPQQIADYWAISKDKLNALPPETFIELRNNGALDAIYAHFVSLLKWQIIIQKAVRTQQPDMQPAGTA